MAKRNKVFVSTVYFRPFRTSLRINKITNICVSGTISDNKTLISCHENNVNNFNNIHTYV